MKIALIALAALVPALAAAGSSTPYVVHEGRAVGSGPAAAPAQETSAVRQTSAFGTSAIHAGVASGSSFSPFAGRASGVRGFRSSGFTFWRRGVIGSAPAGGTGSAPAPAPSAPPAYAARGAKILSAGQQPVYSNPGNGGTHSVEGGGFIAIDQSRANDVGRAPGIAWAPPNRAPSAGSNSGGASGGGGTGGSSNGPTITVQNQNSGGPATAPPTNHGDHGATGFDGSF